MAKKVAREEIETGNFVDGTQGLDSDWIRAARLVKRAEAGDEEAARELEEMKKIRMVPADEVYTPHGHS